MLDTNYLTSTIHNNIPNATNTLITVKSKTIMDIIKAKNVHNSNKSEAGYI